MWIVKGEGMISQSVSKWMRGLAILMVIASHYAGWMFVEPVNPELREWVMTLGVFGVDIFFTMSGYGLVKAASKHGIDKRYVWNRVKTSYIPYIFISLSLSFYKVSKTCPRRGLLEILLFLTNY